MQVAPINRLVDALCQSGRGWVPYVAPMYGGINARLLSLLRDPGPMTRSEGGSAFLSMENDDATAEAISQYFSEVGIPASEIVPWNIYPWYINRAPTASEIEAGLDPLRQFIQLLPRLRLVMLHGGSARMGWGMFFETYHISRQSLLA